MSNRRKSRESALQALFSIDMETSRGECNNETVEDLCKMMEVPNALQGYFMELVKGVFDHCEDIDKCITGTSSNWKLSRMTAVDRNIIRIAVYELMFKDDIPPKVAINEAIEIGKKFGTEKSGPFINGILDSVYRTFINKDGKRDINDIM
jgi:transcription antitermination protein NusB